MDHDAPSSWLPERRRALTAASVTLAASLAGWALLHDADHGWSFMDVVTLALPVYLLVHLAITVVAFTRTSQEQIRAWAGGRRRGGFLQRYVLGTAPGPGVGAPGRCLAPGGAGLASGPDRDTGA